MAAFIFRGTNIVKTEGIRRRASDGGHRCVERQESMGNGVNDMVRFGIIRDAALFAGHARIRRLFFPLLYLHKSTMQEFRRTGIRWSGASADTEAAILM